MKPSQQRASHPDTVNPKWINGKTVFASLIDGAAIDQLGLKDFKDALYYSRSLLFPPRGGSKIKVALRKEAAKLGELL